MITILDGYYIDCLLPACYEQALQARRLSQSRIRVSRTAYYLDDCKELCSRELRCFVLGQSTMKLNHHFNSFRCMGFSYRQPQTQGEVNTCDLTDLDLSSLDRYSTADFVGDNRCATRDTRDKCYTGHVTRDLTRYSPQVRLLPAVWLRVQLCGQWRSSKSVATSEPCHFCNL